MLGRAGPATSSVAVRTYAVAFGEKVEKLIWLMAFATTCRQLRKQALPLRSIV